MRKVYSFSGGLYKMTGIQKVLLDVHHAIRDDFDSYVSGTVPYDELHKDLGLKPNEYRRFVNPFMFFNSIVIVHERKYLLMFWLLKVLLLQHVKIVYIHHNILNDLRYLSKMPRNIVSISDRCSENLVEYFKVPVSHIRKIHNCVSDINPPSHKIPDGSTITILYPARINDVKRQPEIVNRLRGKLNSNIKILFAGDGPLYEELVETIGQDSQFTALGYISDIPSLMQECDYVLLFSEKEGLPITLIEASMCGVPIICNDVGGNTEIVARGKSAFVVDGGWEELVTTLNNLDKVSSEQYQKMSIASREQYIKNFTFERFKNDYVNLLCSLH